MPAYGLLMDVTRACLTQHTTILCRKCDETLMLSEQWRIRFICVPKQVGFVNYRSMMPGNLPSADENVKNFVLAVFKVVHKEGYKMEINLYNILYLSFSCLRFIKALLKLYLNRAYWSDKSTRE